MLSLVLRDISFAFCISLNFPPVPRLLRDRTLRLPNVKEA